MRGPGVCDDAGCGVNDTILKWLAEPWIGAVPFDYEDVRTDDPTVPPNADGSPLTRLQILSALCGINGRSFRVGGYGCVQSGPGCEPYGRIGLEERGAHAFVQMASFLDGMMAMCPDREGINRLLWAQLNAEWDRVFAIRYPEKASAS